LSELDTWFGKAQKEVDRIYLLFSFYQVLHRNVGYGLWITR